MATEARSGGGAAAARMGARAAVEAVVLALATAQHGVVTRAQLLAAGVSPRGVDRRSKSKWLLQLHRGVYRVGPLSDARTPWFAAVLACGRAAVLSHWSAAEAWEILRRRRRSPATDVSLPRSDRRRPGIRVHRYRTLLPEEITSLDGLPITTPARTLLDLAGRADGRELEKAVAEALARGLTTAQGIGAVLECHLGWPGTSRLRALLGEHTPAFTRSRAEGRFLALVRRAQLPVPRVNARLNGFVVDFLWPEERLVTELDGFAFHSSASAFENDRRRDALLTAAGMRVMRVTWRQLVKEPEALMVRLGLALARSEAPAGAGGWSARGGG